LRSIPFYTLISVLHYLTLFISNPSLHKVIPHLSWPNPPILLWVSQWSFSVLVLFHHCFHRYVLPIIVFNISLHLFNFFNNYTLVYVHNLIIFVLRNTLSGSALFYSSFTNTIPNWSEHFPQNVLFQQHKFYLI
jgi:hypothetical protein